MNATAIKGKALSFDGVDDYVDCGNDESLDITDEITVEAWVKLKEVEGGLRQKVIVGKFDGDYDPYALIYDNVSHYVGFKLSADVVKIPYYPYIPDNKWHYLVGTYDGENVRFYFDGELKYSMSNSGSIKSRENPVTIGGWTAQTRFIHGLITEVRIYNRALSEEEILYNKEHPHYPILHGCVLWLSYDSVNESEGKWYDKSGYDNHGTIYGATTVEICKLAGKVMVI